MKLTIHAAALAALIGAGMAGSAAAATIGNGKIYDVGKGSYSTAANADAADGSYCWAASGANLIQYWQDTYYGYRNPGVETPNGETAGYDEPYGTRYLAVYEEALRDGKADKGSNVDALAAWWFNGTPIKESGHVAREGSYTNIFAGKDVTVQSDEYSQSAFAATLKDAFSVQGQAVGLTLMGYNAAQQSFVMLHAVTCWGYEENAAGDVTAVYLADSDDSYFGAFRLEVCEDNLVVNVPLYGWENVDMGVQTIFRTDDDHGLYGESLTYLRNTGVCTTYINTPDSVKKAPVAPRGTVEADIVVLENVKFTGNEVVNGSGVEFGDGKTAMIVTGDAGAGLSVLGGFGGGAGVTVAEGVLVSLENLESMMHEDRGLVNAGKTYVHDGSAYLVYNMADEGGAVLNSGYLEFKGCDEVCVAMNVSFGDGGGVYNEGSLSIRGNGSVTFMENSSLMGGAADIYNAEGGVVSIADNGEVYFMSGAEDPSIVNRGQLYLAAAEDRVISFIGSGIDSREGGSVFIGRDAMGHCGNMAGAVQFAGFGTGDVTYTTVSAVSGAGVAEFRNVQMDAAGIAADERGSVAHAVISSTGSLAFSNVDMVDVHVESAGSITLDCVTLNAADSSFAAAGIFLNNVVVNLAGFAVSGSAEEGLVCDLSRVFGGSVSGCLTLTGFGDGESAVIECGVDTDFSKLSVTKAPAVLDSLKDVELALAVENAGASVTLGGGVTGVTLSNGLTQTVEAAADAVAGTLADLDGNGVTLLPETLEMDAAGLEAMADVLGAAESAEGLMDRDVAGLVKAAEGRGHYPMMLSAAVHGPMVAVTGANTTVPEPATGMLSLLALAGLCARRRRK